MRLLITGGVGYIGSHIVLAALDKKFDVTVFDDFSSANISNINPKVQLVVGSTKSDEDLSKLFENKTYDGVIHLAASKSADESVQNPKKYAKNNIIGGLNLLNKCIEHNVKYFIFSSTAAVYGKPKYIPIDELHSLKPINFYGFTKLSFENNLKWYSYSYGINYASLRYFNAAGYDLEGRVIGAERNPQNLIPIIMETAIGRRPSILIFGDNYETKDGTGVRDYIHVSDLARAHINAFEYIFNKKENLIANLGSEKGHSVLDVIKITRDVTNTDIPYKITKPRQGDVSELIASSTLAKNIIGFKPYNSCLKKIIDSTWNIYKNQ